MGILPGRKGEIDWHVVDEDFNKYAIQLLKGVDTILFGRVTYQLFEEYWPAELKNPKTSKNDGIIAKLIDNAQKIVFSMSLKDVSWNNSKLFSGISEEEIVKLKKLPGKDIVVYGSGTIVQTLANLNLIDEYRFIVAPVILGKGRTLFHELKEKLNLELIKTKKLACGDVILEYKPVNNTK
jgi:dihydrofolate reductase